MKTIKYFEKVSRKKVGVTCKKNCKEIKRMTSLTVTYDVGRCLTEDFFITFSEGRTTESVDYRIQSAVQIQGTVNLKQKNIWNYLGFNNNKKKIHKC